MPWIHIGLFSGALRTYLVKKRLLQTVKGGALRINKKLMKRIVLAGRCRKAFLLRGIISQAGKCNVWNYHMTSIYAGYYSLLYHVLSHTGIDRLYPRGKR